MSEFKIYKWNDIADYFRGSGLILGNGASRAIDDEHFSYTSILEEAKKLQLITPDLEKIFTFFNTSDFERILQKLWHTKYINEALDVENPKLTQAYNDVQKALIVTVSTIHENVSYDSVKNKLEIAADYLSQFKMVFSLNYDVLAYWAILIGNDNNPKQFSDCFVHQVFQYNWEDFKNTYGTLIFYPHGNLVLGRDINDIECKIHAEDRKDLLDTIIGKWVAGGLAPVFVSEGDCNQKLRTIQRSPYMSTVLRQVMPKVGGSFVIYGWSMSGQDNHIVEEICKSSARKFAISVHSTSGQLQEKCARIKRKLEQNLSGGFELIFFDSESKGCWIHN